MGKRSATLEQSQDPRARLAIALMEYRIGRELGSLAAALGGLDGIVFSGGIGENSASLCKAVCRDAAAVGGAGAACISAAGSAVAVWVLPANEELMIARHAQCLLDASVEADAAPASAV